jgi:hypothetical protein
MTKAHCSLSDCTLPVTGMCVLSHASPSTCPNFVRDDESSEETVSKSPKFGLKTRPISGGNELGTQELSGLMSRRYGTLVGVIGETGTGKTCLLSALYLLASVGELRPGLMFAGSSTLVGFEQRLRLLRGWPGPGLPEQIVEHTVLNDPRRPGFVHLAFVDTKPLLAHDLFFSDLPGEWTTDLVKRSAAANKFIFLRRADSLLYVVTAPSLLSGQTRHNQVQNCRIVLQRLRDTIGIRREVPITFAVTRCDVTGPTLPPAAYDLVTASQEFGFPNASISPVAAFSARDDVPSGFGLGELMETIIGSPRTQGFRASDAPVTIDGRMFTRFRTGT